MTPTNAPADRPRRRERLVWSVLVFAVALAVRCLHLWQLQGSPLLELLMGDARSYDSWARQIAGGDWLGNEVFYQAPLYPYFLAAIYACISDDLLSVRVLQALLGAGSCVLISLAGWRLFSKPAGIAAGLLLAVYAPAIFADTTLQKSVLVIFLLCLSLWILAGIAVRSRPRPGPCLALGASIGALVLARENALIFALVLAPWLLLTSPAAGARRWIPTALFATGMALVLFPVALRNLYVGGELHLTTAQLGPNLFIGNNPIADGTYVPLLPGRGDARYERSDATELAERALGRQLTPSEVSRFFVGRVLAYVRDDPGGWLALLARKLALAFNAVEIVDTEDLYTHAESSLPLRLLGSCFHFGVLAPLALIGIWITRSASTRLLPLYLLLLAYAATLVAFYVFARYRLPLAVLLLPFAAAGLVRLPELRAEGMPGIAIPAVAAVAAAVFCNWPIVDREYMRSVTHYNLGNELLAADRPEAAMREYRQAIRLREGNAQARNNLGVILASRGDLTGAEEQYQGALRISPSYVDARLNLARSLRERGDSRAAIEHYEHARRLSPERAEVHDELGEVYAEIGESDLASRSFERARRIQQAPQGTKSGS